MPPAVPPMATSRETPLLPTAGAVPARQRGGQGPRCQLVCSVPVAPFQSRSRLGVGLLRHQAQLPEQRNLVVVEVATDDPPAGVEVSQLT